MDKAEKFIIKSKEKFGEAYGYNEIKYVDSTTDISIKCNKHNIFFSQKPVEHLRGRAGCNLCSKNPKVDTEYFINKSKEIHGERYNYSLSKYVDSNTKIKIMCKEHGVFEQLPNNHYKQNCPSCSDNVKNGKKLLTNDIFISKSKLKHGEKYKYSLVNYINSQTKVKIICPEHGIFEQFPYSHIRGKGCNLCSIHDRTLNLTKDIKDFITDAKNQHGDKYDYSLVEYINSKTKIKITCPEHGEFEQLPYDHIANHGCPKCGLTYNKSEDEIKDFIQSLGLHIETNTRKIIQPLELDIFIPSHNLAIEYNGLYWHSELYKGKNYHLNKTEACEAKGIQLIHIFEDEWLHKSDIVKSRLINILGLTKDRIYARKTEIREVNSKDSKIFLDMNHIQGNVNASIRLGLYYNNELVSFMTFNKPRLGIGTSYYGYELSRFCNKLNTTIIGGADKLLKYFIKTYTPKEIISYADRRWSIGNLYEKLGFIKIHFNKPNYSYIIGLKRKHRFGFRKEILKNLGFDTKNLSEHTIMVQRNIYRIYDSGTITYKFIPIYT